LALRNNHSLTYYWKFVKHLVLVMTYLKSKNHPEMMKHKARCQLYVVCLIQVIDTQQKITFLDVDMTIIE